MPEQLRRRRILIAALAGAGLAALGITVASSHAAPDRNGRIAFTHRSFTPECCQETDDVMTIEPDGSDPRRLTNSTPGGGSEGPAWAAHGNRVLFDSDRADGRSHLSSMNGNGNGVTQLTHGGGNEALASESPDGKLIAFDGYFPDAAPDGVQGIYLTGEDGGSYPDFRRLTVAPADGFDTAPDFAPDAATIAFRRVHDTATGEVAAVFMVGADGTGLRQLTPYLQNLVYPRWSPDGSRIVFTSNGSDNTGDVWTVGAGGGALTQLTHETTGHHAFQADWSPDGTKLVFAHFAPTGFFTDLEVMNADGSDVHTVWQGVDFSIDERPAWGTRP